MNDIQVKVLAYKGHLIINTVDPRLDSEFWIPGNGEPCSRNRLLDTSRFLGISVEAAEWLRRLHETPDVTMGDIDWYTVEGHPEFGYFEWEGGYNRIFPIAGLILGQGFEVINFNAIPNTLPVSAVQRIETKIAVREKAWAQDKWGRKS